MAYWTKGQYTGSTVLIHRPWNPIVPAKLSVPDGRFLYMPPIFKPCAAEQ